jgi:hypothetical protein
MTFPRSFSAVCGLVGAWVWLSGLCSAQGLSLQDLEKIVRERQAAIRSVECEFSIQTEFLYKLSDEDLSDRFLRPIQRQIVVERDRFYSCERDPNPTLPKSAVQTLRVSWNGKQRYRAGEYPDGYAKNLLWGSFDTDAAGSNLHLLDLLDFNPEAILGKYDRLSQAQTGFLHSPLRVFERIQDTEDAESLQMCEIDWEGRKCVQLSLASKGEVIPLVEHIFDPSLEYACVATRLYLPSGLLRTIRREYERDSDGRIQLQSGHMTTTVRSYAGTEDKHDYPAEDFDKVATVQHIHFTKLRINQPVDPQVYEARNVFFPAGETWDFDKQLMLLEYSPGRRSLGNITFAGGTASGAGSRATVPPGITDRRSAPVRIGLVLALVAVLVPLGWWLLRRRSGASK